jgi:adenylosuccinate lyase
MLVNLVLQMDTLLRRKDENEPTFLERLTVNETNCKKNLQTSANFVLAEPIYIALQMAGYNGDAHELVNRQAMPRSQKYGMPLINSIIDLAQSDSELATALANIPQDVLALLKCPESYTGDASEKAFEIADMAEVYAG